MSAFTPKVKSIDGRAVRMAYEQQKIARMIANGSTEEHAFKVIADARRVREAKREQRRRAGEFIRAERGEYDLLELEDLSS